MYAQCNNICELSRRTSSSITFQVMLNGVGSEWGWCSGPAGVSSSDLLEANYTYELSTNKQCIVRLFYYFKELNLSILSLCNHFLTSFHTGALESLACRNELKTNFMIESTKSVEILCSTGSDTKWSWQVEVRRSAGKHDKWRCQRRCCRDDCSTKQTKIERCLALVVLCCIHISANSFDTVVFDAILDDIFKLLAF